MAEVEADKVDEVHRLDAAAEKEDKFVRLSMDLADAQLKLVEHAKHTELVKQMVDAGYIEKKSEGVYGPTKNFKNPSGQGPEQFDI